jgi:hypothetical protein
MATLKGLFFLVFIGIPISAYRLLTRKAFYVSGTFIDNSGERMWFTTTFCTYGNILPILSLRESIAKLYGVEKVVILHFSRMPYGMVKYVERDIGIDMETSLVKSSSE